MPNGGTVLLGGLISDSTDKNQSNVPWLRDVPLVGDLVGGRTRTNDRNELLIFLQPKIIDTELDRQSVDADLKTRTDVARIAEPFAGDAPVATASAVPAKSGFFKRVMNRLKWAEPRKID